MPIEMSIEEVARYPLPGMAAPGAFAFSPDDALIAYLRSPDRSLVRDLYLFDPETGEERLLVRLGEASEEELSLEEKLRRERQRQRELGVTGFAWREGRLLLPLRGDIYLQDGPDAPLRRVVEGGGKPALSPQLSPDGRWLAYVQDAELCVVAAEGGKPRQLTCGARETGKTHGLAEYLAQEEMGRSEGFWWSPDSRSLAFAEVDETRVPVYRILHQGKGAVGEGAQEDHRYPFAGGPNARVRLGVVPVGGGEPVWMSLGEMDSGEAEYLARVHWFPGGTLAAQLQDRRQRELTLVRFDPETGASTVLLRETSEVWINLHDLFRPLEGGGFLWASERTGFRHLYLYDADGRPVRPLTEGAWMVDSLEGVDEEQGIVYLTGSAEGPLERHLYAVSLHAVSLPGGEPKRLSAEPGMHSVTLDHKMRRFVDVHHALARPPTVTLRSLADGERIATVCDEPDPRVAELGLGPPERVTLESRDGETLHGAIYQPPASFGSGPFPTIVSVYGGPHAQRVTNGWDMTVDMRAQALASLGFLVFKLDNRGSARRGLLFEGAIKGRMGELEVGDQVDGVRWLAAQGLADLARVGVYGWSYGGYLAAMSLCRAPEVFKVAVAGAPVTHWDGYDSHYSERYLGLPGENPQGYEASSVMRHIEGLRGKLLLVHGLIDENVHFRHTARLIGALNRARKPYDLLLLPDERHMPRKEADRVYMEERVRDYFLSHL
ncbi:MAG: S9 family peptidase [Deinococcota bacterium]|jgi:dipeptidyl-peptidase-4|nr:S9 family peptidase [Deinococcota bacterium]